MTDFSDDVKKTIVNAEGIALKHGTVRIEREHLLAAVLEYLTLNPHEAEVEQLATALTV